MFLDKIFIVILYLLLSLPTTSSTSSNRESAYYDIILQNVECSPKPGNIIGEIGKIPIKEEIFLYYYEDSVLKITWFISGSNIRYAITNKSEKNLRIIWDQAVYIDENGTEHNLLDKEGILASGYTFESIMIPKDYIYTLKGIKQYYPLFADFMKLSIGYFDARRGRFINDNEYREINQGYIGKQFKISLPIENSDKVYIYSFYFLIKAIYIFK